MIFALLLACGGSEVVESDVFDFEVRFAAWDDIGEEIVVATDEPSPALHMIDPITGASRSIALSRVPTDLSVRGGRAAVGHVNAASVVDLATAVTTTAAIDDAGGGYVILPDGDFAFFIAQLDGSAWAISITEGEARPFTMSGSDRSLHTALHPDGRQVYGTHSEVNPNDVYGWVADGGTLVSTGQSPYHGDYQFGSSIWVPSADRLVTHKADVFHVGAGAGELEWIAKLPEPPNVWAAAGSEAHDRLALAYRTHEPIYVYSLGDLEMLGSLPVDLDLEILSDAVFMDGSGGVHALVELGPHEHGLLSFPASEVP